MSEQSPWGVPPPSDPHPGYQPTGAGGWSGGPPSYGVPLGHGPQGPQPPRRRTGLVLAVVAAVLLVAAAFTITLVVVGNDGEGEPGQASSSDATSDPTTEPTSSSGTPETSAPTEPTGEPTDETTTRTPTADGDIVGEGYSYDLPAPGWRDASSEAKELAETIDTAIILGSSLDLSQSSIVVEALNSGFASSLEQLEAPWKRNLSSTDDATPVDIAETSIAGERAIGVRIDDRLNDAGDPIRQIAYLVLHEDRQYSIALSFPGSGDVTSQADFEEMLASWSWTN